MTNITIPVERTMIMSGNTNDLIIIKSSLDSPIPNKENAYFKIEVEKNKGEYYCKNILGITDYEVINLRSKKYKI